MAMAGRGRVRWREGGREGGREGDQKGHFKVLTRIEADAPITLLRSTHPPSLPPSLPTWSRQVGNDGKGRIRDAAHPALAEPQVFDEPEEGRERGRENTGDTIRGGRRKEEGGRRGWKEGWVDEWMPPTTRPSMPSERQPTVNPLPSWL